MKRMRRADATPISIPIIGLKAGSSSSAALNVNFKMIENKHGFQNLLRNH